MRVVEVAETEVHEVAMEAFGVVEITEQRQRIKILGLNQIEGGRHLDSVPLGSPRSW